MHNGCSFLSNTQVVQNIVQTETEYCKELQTLLSTYLRALQPTDRSEHKPGVQHYTEIVVVQYSSLSLSRLSVSDISHIMGNLEEISSFQQTLVHSLEESVK